MLKKTLIATALSAVFLSGCQETSTNNNTQANPATTTQTEVAQTESEKANAFFDETFMRDVMRSPVYQTYMGIKQDYDKWDDGSEARSLENLALAKKDLEALQQFNYDALDDNTKVSYDLLKQSLEETIADFKWRYHTYPVNQMFGTHSMVPAFLINQHQIASVDDANAYISRLNGIPTVFTQLEKDLEIRAEKGIIAPKFVFPHVIDSSKNILKGAPFEEGEDSTLLADFKRKVNALEIEETQKNVLIATATESLSASVLPAYQSLINYLVKLEERADTKDGVWKAPQGDELYNVLLQRTTTTDLTADEIHKIGLDEVARIHSEMNAIKEKVGFKGDLKAFMTFMKSDKQFYLPNTEEGKQAYLDDAVKLIDDMKLRLDEVFIVKPKARPSG